MRGSVQFAKRDLILINLDIAETFNVMSKMIKPDPACLKDQRSDYTKNALNHLRQLWCLFEDNNKLLIEANTKDEYYYTCNIFEKVKDDFSSLMIILVMLAPTRLKEPPMSPRDLLVMKQNDHFAKFHELVKNTNIDECDKQLLMEEVQRKLQTHWNPIENGHREIRKKFYGAIPDTGYELAYIAHKIMYQSTLSLLNYKIDALTNSVQHMIPPIGIPTWRMFKLNSEVHPFSVKSQLWEKIKGLDGLIRRNRTSEVDKRQLLIRTFLTNQVPTHMLTCVIVKEPGADSQNMDASEYDESNVPLLTLV